MFAVFVSYVAYLAFVKREAKKYLHTLIYPGIFFFAIWAFIFFLLYN